MDAATLERFWSKVQRSSGCWTWIGAVNENGYGTFMNEDGRMEYAHRFSFRLHFGLIPDGMEVCHDCDNPPCVRPDDLFTGTHADNMADMVSKGRHPRRERHGSAVLTGADVAAIRQALETGARGTASRLAREYGVSRSIISRIKLRKNWR